MLWLLPTSEEDERAAFAEVDPAERAELEAMTGLDLREVVARIQALAVTYPKDPRAMRAEVVRLLNGNEIAAEQILKLLASVWDDREPVEKAPTDAAVSCRPRRGVRTRWPCSKRRRPTAWCGGPGRSGGQKLWPGFGLSYIAVHAITKES